jgi:hypothetical protein
MARIDELKKQFPYLNKTFFDFFKIIDPTKSYKYYPILCDLVKDELNIDSKDSDYISTIKDYFEALGLDVSGLSNIELIIYDSFIRFLDQSKLKTIMEFIDYIENNLIENKDVTSYKSLSEIEEAVSLASLKKIRNKLRKYVHVEFEDETWIAVRPLTFESSHKYGSATRWCTTSEKNKEVFLRYVRNGVLVYFINKKTGYKFAGYKEMTKTSYELSFWDSKDQRVDSIFLDVDISFLKIIKEIFESNIPNIDFCTDKMKESVINECTNNLFEVEFPFRTIPVQDNILHTATGEIVNGDRPTDHTDIRQNENNEHITLNVIYRPNILETDEE